MIVCVYGTIYTNKWKLTDLKAKEIKMFQLQVMILILAVIAPYLEKRISKKKLQIVIILLGIFTIIFGLYLLLHLRIMQIIGFAILFVCAEVISYNIKESGICWMSLCVNASFLPIIILAFLMNRGFITRVYDPAHVLSFVEEYNINQTLKYEGRLESTTNCDHNEVYLITQNLDGNFKKENKYINKLKEKAEYSNYYIVKLNYDKEKNFIGCGYDYSFQWDSARGSDSGCEIIAKEINKHGVALSAGKITQVVDACISSYSSPFEDMDEGDEDPGVHWVNGYDRSDGTHVDGYLRTNPDGDPTNNFSYEGE